jgi:hypothetical protein
MRTQTRVCGGCVGTGSQAVIRVDDWDYIMSTLGNAYYSDLTFDEVWSCVNVSCTPEQFDAAVLITLRLKEILSDEK